MRIIKSGTPVKTVIGEVKALVIGVCIRGGGEANTIEYNIRYFANGEEKSCWVYGFEIEIDKPNVGTGFNRDRSQDEVINEQTYLLNGN